MKYISKIPEPHELIDWKKQQKKTGVNCNYKSIQNPEKKIVHNSLLKEQGYICCYCCQRIKKEQSHIEHFAPQSKTNDDLSIDYDNLLASCEPYEQQKQQWPKHCGNYKENKPIPVSPLEENCEDYFAYTAVGEIIPTQAKEIKIKAEKTINTLGLNDAELRQMRSGVLEGILQDINTLTDEDAKKLALNYQNPDQNGHYQPFCVALLYFLKQYFKI